MMYPFSGSNMIMRHASTRSILVHAAHSYKKALKTIHSLSHQNPRGLSNTEMVRRFFKARGSASSARGKPQNPFEEHQHEAISDVQYGPRELPPTSPPSSPPERVTHIIYSDESRSRLHEHLYRNDVSGGHGLTQSYAHDYSEPISRSNNIGKHTDDYNVDNDDRLSVGRGSNATSRSSRRSEADRPSRKAQPVVLMIDEGVELEIGDEEGGFMPYDQYLAYQEDRRRRRRPQKKAYYIIPGNRPIIFQDDSGREIHRVGDFSRFESSSSRVSNSKHEGNGLRGHGSSYSRRERGRDEHGSSHHPGPSESRTVYIDEPGTVPHDPQSHSLSHATSRFADGDVNGESAIQHEHDGIYDGPGTIEGQHGHVEVDGAAAI
ncbi:hypothetical protein BD410DRAFT_779740 [Rickenella mellea]|uniref:Uncharacterized protein n=1 Tax=Rickenella mellea TaxID=50990 RepID=A0A4R5XFI0_9AGAM|nr:hypothetical protein BD410DRAFT_779740 [Rickenella mellea]